MINSFQGRVVVAPTCDTGIYASGDLIGGKLTLTGLFLSGEKGTVIKTVTIADEAKQSSALTLVFFRSDPSATTFTDQSALDVADADLLNCFVASVAATDYVSFADNSVATINPELAVASTNNGVLYMCVVSRGTPTYAAATDLQVTIESI